MQKLYKPLLLYFIFFITHYYAQEISSASASEFNITSSTAGHNPYATNFHIAQLNGGNQDTIADYNQAESPVETSQEKKSPLNKLEAGILSASGLLVVAGIAVGIVVWKNNTRRRRNLKNQLDMEENRKDHSFDDPAQLKKRFSFPSISGHNDVHHIIPEITNDNFSDFTDQSSFSKQQLEQRRSFDELSLEKTPQLEYEDVDIVDQQPQPNRRERSRPIGDDPRIPPYALQKFLKSDLPFAQREHPRDFDDKIIKTKPMQINIALDPSEPIRKRNFVDLIQEVERQPIQSPLDLPQDCYIPLKDAVGPRLISRAEVMADPIRRQGQDELALWEENCRKKKISKEVNRKQVALCD